MAILRRFSAAWLASAALCVTQLASAEPEAVAEPFSPPPEAAAHEAGAQPPGAQPPPLGRDAEQLEQLHVASIHTRRLLADSVLVAGLVSVAGGAALIVPDADDQAWRFAGVNTAIFGAVNTVVGLLALSGIAREERTWESTEARAARRTPDGLVRARVHAAIDERRESVGHAINLGLNCAYLGVAGTAVLASQLGVEHPNRWLASGAAIGFQALFLVGIDFIGLSRSHDYHRAFVEGFLPSVSVMPTPAGMETRIGLGASF
jgi:hypothetical protein